MLLSKLRCRVSSQFEFIIRQDFQQLDPTYSFWLTLTGRDWLVGSTASNDGGMLIQLNLVGQSRAGLHDSAPIIAKSSLLLCNAPGAHVRCIRNKLHCVKLHQFSENNIKLQLWTNEQSNARPSNVLSTNFFRLRNYDEHNWAIGNDVISPRPFVVYSDFVG